VCRDEALKARIDLLRNFGFKGETRVLATGINAKMNELQAAFGCLTLSNIDGKSPPAPDCGPLRRRLCPPARPAPAGRAARRDTPQPRLLPGLHGSRLPPEPRRPVHRLREQGIIARRYFYPLISDFDMYRDAPGADHLPVARRMADTVLCLPLRRHGRRRRGRVIDAVSAAART
jgi:dTDP-4-amino-4,6-dideoxygalactose transaminase